MDMPHDPDSQQVAAGLHASIGLLVRRLRQSQPAGELTLPETSALARLDRGGPATASALAKAEQISPQSMGATLARLESRGLIARRADPEDGRRIVMSVNEAGLVVLLRRRNERSERLAQALSEFTDAELVQLGKAVPLIERLAHNL